MKYALQFYTAICGFFLLVPVRGEYLWTNFAGLAGGAGNADGTTATARFQGPSGVAVDAEGTVFLADLGNNLIRKITSAGVVSTLAGSRGTSGTADGTGGAARFNRPRAIALGGDDHLYVADEGNNSIRRVTKAGVVTTVAGATDGSNGTVDGPGTAARFLMPAGVAVDGGGNIYVADTGNHRLVVGRPSIARQAWRMNFFGTTANAGLAADAADANANGIANLLEYALGGDPVGNSPGSVLPTASLNEAGRQQLLFTRYLDRTDLILTVQASDSLSGVWENLAQSVNGGAFYALVAGVTVSETGSGAARTVSIADFADPADPARPSRFLRLSVAPSTP